MAAEAFLEKVAASPVQTELAKRSRVESVVVASAIGGSAVKDVLASKVPDGDRPIDKLLHTLLAEEQKRGFDAAESGGGPLGKTIAGQDKGLRQDPRYAAARDDLAARSLGFDAGSGKAVEVGREWEARRELDGRFAEPVGDVGGTKIYPPDLLRENREQLASVADLSTGGGDAREARHQRDWELAPASEPAERRPDPVPAEQPAVSPAPAESPVVPAPDPVSAEQPAPPVDGTQPPAGPDPSPEASEWRELDHGTRVHVTAKVADDVVLGRGVTIGPAVELEPGVVVGDGAEIAGDGGEPNPVLVQIGAHLGPGAHLEAGVTVGEGARLGEGCVVRDGAHVGHEVQLGPWAEVRSGAELGDRTRVGEGCTVGADVVVGRDVRLDEGTVVGKKSTVGDRAHLAGYGAAGHGVRTGDGASIGADAQIGSDCLFLGAAVVGDGAHVGSRVALHSAAQVEPGAFVYDESVVRFRGTVTADQFLPSGTVQKRDGTRSSLEEAGINLQEGGPPRLDFPKAVGRVARVVSSHATMVFTRLRRSSRRLTIPLLLFAVRSSLAWSSLRVARDPRRSPR